MDLAEIITKSLNDPQRKAVEHMDGPMLILAGAGSGKTRVLTSRMAYLIAQGAAAPDEILCVTFTNKAAKEMEHRIYKSLSELQVPVRNELWVNTFHSFCVRVLRQHITLMDYKAFFAIYDSSDQLSLIKKVMNNLNINDKMYPPKNFQHRISNAKMLGLSPIDIGKGNRSMMDPKTLEVFTAYEAELKRANALDFDDLLLKTYDLFRMYPAVLEDYQKKFRYIMVDEYQDTNHIQYLLVQLLAKAHRNLCVVGDEDQSIYSWRGADIRNILDFEKDFTEAVVIKLEENYRSSSNIVDAATSVIKNNTQRKDKTLFTSNEAGELITVREEKNEYDEARFVAKTIENLMNAGEANYNDFAIFYRTNAQSRVLEEQLRQLLIPYKLIGGVRFYERMEIKDILAYMKLSLNLQDDIAFKRVINVPARGIGKTTVEKLEEFATQNNLSLYMAAQQAIHSKMFNAGTTGKIRRYVDLLDDLTGQTSGFSLADFYHIVLDRTEYVNSLKSDDSPEAAARVENLEELDNAIAQFSKERGEEGTLQSFLEEIALVSDVDQVNTEVNCVTMMTLHISKGLEFPYVFIVGLEENLFPSARSNEGDDKDEVEEERRLAYVGMTRARKKLHLTYTKVRRVWGQEQMNPPSRFIAEIPKQYLDYKSGVEGPRFFDRYGSGSGNSSSYGSGSASGANANSWKNRNNDYDSQAFPDYENEELSNAIAKAQVAQSGYGKGTRVRHPTFGAGTVFATEGAGEQLKVSVMFSDNTIKKFIVKYARLEKV